MMLCKCNTQFALNKADKKLQRRVLGTREPFQCQQCFDATVTAVEQKKAARRSKSITNTVRMAAFISPETVKAMHAISKNKR